eukprot:jgi/Botrbrau1/10992/Bobra.0234s0016.2
MKAVASEEIMGAEVAADAGVTSGLFSAPPPKPEVRGRLDPGTQRPEGLQKGVPSMLAFASADLEVLYQKYISNTVSWSACCCCLVTIFAWLSFFSKASFGTAAARAVMPTVSVPLACNFLPAVALVLLLNLKPQAYIKRYRLLHLLMSVFQMGVTNYVRELFLWMHSGSFQSSRHSYHAFLAENFYLSIMWIRVLCFPVDQFCDLSVVTTILLINMAGNTYLCNSPFWGSSPVTLSRPVMTIMQYISPRLLSVLLPGAEGHVPDCSASACPASCPLALAFWEIVGWYICCLLVLLRELVTRRAFLAANHQLLSPEHAARAHKWPFGSAMLVSNCVTAVVLLYIIGSLTWALSLSLYV